MTTSTAPRQKSIVTKGVTKVATGTGHFLQRRYLGARRKAGKNWAVVAPTMLAGGEWAANEYAPQVETSNATGDMVVASSGALAVAAMMTTAMKGVGMDIEKNGNRRFIQITSAAAGMAIDFTTGVHAPGAEFADVSAPTVPRIIVGALASIAGGVAGYSSGRALTQ